MKNQLIFESEPFELLYTNGPEYSEEEEGEIRRRSTQRSSGFRSSFGGFQRPVRPRPRPKFPRPRPLPLPLPVFPLHPIVLPPTEPSRDASSSTGSANAPTGPAEPRPEGNEYIRWVQSTLNRVLGLSLPVDGIIGVETRSAIRSFQQQRGLPADGIVGPPTERALIKASSTPSPGPASVNDNAPPPASNNAPSPNQEFEFEQFRAFDTGLAWEEFETGVNRNSPSYIRWVQQSLNQLIGSRLAVDGVTGPQTRSAIRSFQQRRGLVVDGIVGPKTEAALIAAGARPFSASTPSTPITPVRPGCDVLDGFDFDDDRVKPSHQLKIIKVAREIVASQGTPRPIRVADLVGHTDRVGDDAYNVGLGKRRADQTAQSLRQTMDRIKPGSSRGITLRTDSRGESQPVSTDQARNRRVEICLLKPPKPVPPKPKPPVTPPPPPRVPTDLERLIDLVKRILNSLPGLGLTGIKVPTRARFLTSAEQSEAMKVFGGSLDFTKILISDGLGFQGRAFTVAVPLASGSHVVMNLGDLGPWETRPRSHTLIHELAHAWQSQHHGSDPTAFMKNSVLCQVRALADLPIAKAEAAAAATAAAVSRGVLDPRTLASIARKASDAEDVSPYAYIPGKTFGDYAAEQIAQQVEDEYRGGGRPTPGIVRTIRSVSANARSRDNETSLGVTSFHRKSERGVVFP